MTVGDTGRFLGCLCIGVLLSVPAQADPMLIFKVGNSGTISYAGGANPLVGASIVIPTLVAANDPFNNGTYSIVGGQLSFHTGNFLSFDSAAHTLTFDAGGSILITGTVQTPGGGTIAGPAANPLLSGSFLGGTFDLNDNRFSLFLANGPDTKNAALVTYFFGGATPAWTFSADIYGAHDVRSDYRRNGRFSTDVVSSPTIGSQTFDSQIVNIDPTDVVPEPASIVLLATAFLITTVISRRSIKQRREES